MPIQIQENPLFIETDRLTLRPYQPGDEVLLISAGQKNRDHLQRFEADNLLFSFTSLAETESLIKELAAGWATHKYLFLGAFEKTSGDFAAQIYIGVTHWDYPEFEIGYMADVDHVGQGYVSEVVKATLQYLFKHLNAHRVNIHTSDQNLSSLKVALRCGFVQEGHLRENHKKSDGLFEGELILGLLKSEFRPD
jgi:ribosomal-protein-alanine N-acetyltransferase